MQPAPRRRTCRAEADAYSGQSASGVVTFTGMTQAQVIPLKPAGIRELSPRAIICDLAVAAVMGASYPYIVLKLSFGPNVSVIAAFFGYLTLNITFKDYNRWENNM